MPNHFYVPHVHILIAPYNFRDEELFETKKILEEGGAIVTVVSTTKLEVPGMMGGTATPDMLLEEVECRSCDALVLVGGTGAKVYFNNEAVLNLIKSAQNYGKIICAICMAPSILANAGVLSGKKATACASEKSNLEMNGANYVNKGVVRDGNIITAQGPANSVEFGKEILKALKENHKL